jgi:hypothetical protein
MINIELTKEDLHKVSILGNIGCVVKHFKGNLYTTMGTAKDCNTGKQVMIYKALYGNCEVYIRDLKEFLSKTDKVKHPDSTQEYRFELVELPDEANI